jgi:hypothetical protein
MPQELNNFVCNSNKAGVIFSDLVIAIDLLNELRELQVLINIALEQTEKYADIDSPLHRITVLLEMYQCKSNTLLEEAQLHLSDCQGQAV